MPDDALTNPAFTYRAGVRLSDTVVTCDGWAATDLLFLSHAPVLSPHGRRGLPSVGRGRRQLLATEATLTLLGPVGERLRPHALLAPVGRPFALGDLRLEVVSSGHLPGGASLLSDKGGRRLLYAGPIGDGADLRAAHAVCLDARWAGAGPGLPSRADAEAAVRAAAADRADGQAPVLLIDPPALAPGIVQVLADAGLAVRTHRKILEAFAVYRRALGLTRPVTAVQRLAGRLAPGELLLWPAGAPLPALAARPLRRVVSVGPRASGEGGVPFPFGADASRALAYVAATGASEVALVGAPDDHLLELLRGRGRTAYRLGPARQMPLFR
jgi:hypothetical protein